MSNRFTIDEVRARTYKSRDAWWTVLLVDPLASRLVQLVARYPAITPNRLTVIAFLLGLASAACFAMADYRWLVAGALLFHLSFVVDCMDGKVARLTGSGSVFGAWLDYVFDRLRVLACAAALMGGQYERTGELTYLLVGGGVIFLDMFRYLNALQIGKVKHDMRFKLAEAAGPGAATPAFVEETLIEHPTGAAREDAVADADRPVVDVNGDFRSRFGSFVRFRNLLVRRRIRAHVVSGIEFQMAVFIIGPVVGAVIGVAVGAGALLLGFELLLVYKLWLATKSFNRQLAAIDAPAIPSQRRPVEVSALTPAP
ncbi:MAG TPA: CDP-alcohol phosphatidyltransferase family protein [Pilimelia sp.]|nr:CDP-alcohol phosphatidyltransferase family protein [Pilimelia sp.]